MNVMQKDQSLLIVSFLMSLQQSVKNEGLFLDVQSLHKKGVRIHIYDGYFYEFDIFNLFSLPNGTNKSRTNTRNLT